jgi:N-acetylglucosaminyldiphosphoundecaprenol N-acetyl-beta-D-mannosaminyltransferase
MIQHNQLNKLTLFDVTFLNVRMQQALELITEAIKAGTQKTIYFVNADCLNKSIRDKTYFQILKQGDYIFADGSGIKLGCKIMGQEVLDNVNGTDLLPRLCDLAVKNDFSLYLLGAKPGVAAKMKMNLEKHYPGIKILGEQNGFFDKNSNVENQIIQSINDLQPDILLVALGVPSQEKWIHEHKKNLLPKMIIGVGGLFDFYSGNIPRAPVWLRKRGLEWTYRLYQEPRRLFKRYIIGNPLFLYRVYKWKFLKYKQNKS